MGSLIIHTIVSLCEDKIKNFFSKKLKFIIDKCHFKHDKIIPYDFSTSHDGLKNLITDSLPLPTSKK